MNTKINNAFKNELNKINEAGDTWFTTQYQSATKTLAEIFQTLYVARGKYFDKSLVSKEAHKSHYKLLKEACDVKGCTYRSTAPTVAELLVKLAFFKPNAEKRVSGYLRAFNTLTVLEEVNETNVSEFILAAGGIEEVRLIQEDGTSKVDKEKVATDLVNGMKALSVMSDSQYAKANTANAGQIVIMVGVQTAEGTVELKDYVWMEREAGDKKLSGKTAIRTALMNVYSVNNSRAVADKDKNAQATKSVRTSIISVKDKAKVSGTSVVNNGAHKETTSPTNSDLMKRAIEDIKGKEALEFVA
jgi:anti-sigma28 factor (negative regulator of flagellin synthesis)